jgi:hypothetical protein
LFGYFRADIGKLVMAHPLKPVLQALVLAEHVYTDKASGKKVIAGTFNALRFKHDVPSIHEASFVDGATRPVVEGDTETGCPYAYISLTDVLDGTTITLQFVYMTQSKVLFSTDFPLKCNDRLRTIEIVAPLPQLSRFIVGAGTYAMEILCHGDILGSHRVLAKEMD